MSGSKRVTHLCIPGYLCSSSTVRYLETADEGPELLLLVGVQLGQLVLTGLQLLVIVREVSAKKIKKYD